MSMSKTDGDADRPPPAAKPGPPPMTDATAPDEPHIMGSDTVRLARQSMRMQPEGLEPDPTIPQCVVADGHVACAKCGQDYEVTEEYYNSIAECVECGVEFLVLPPAR